MTLLTIKDVQRLIDQTTGYGLDSFSRKTLESLQPEALGRHLLTIPEVRRIMEDYDKRQRKSGQPRIPNRPCGRATKYPKPDIMRFLEDKATQNTLAEYFYKRCGLVGGIYIPVVLTHSHPVANPEEELLWL